MAGYLLLIGQLTDGLATPFVGIESDRVGLLGRLYGKRKSWHLFGTVCVVLSFIFIFTPGKSTIRVFRRAKDKYSVLSNLNYLT